MGRPGFLAASARCTLVACLAAACGAGGDGREQVARVPSPDGGADAIITREGGCGAACRWTDEVYLVPHGAPLPPDHKWASFGGTDAESLAVRWRGPRTLEVGYRRAEIFALRNKWYLDPAAAGQGLPRGRYVVEVRLAPTDTVSIERR